MNFKRILLLSGHYGSGKTNIAVNLALELKKQRQRVTIADVDIVNPYFRTSDSRKDLDAAGIRLICSDFAGSNVDLPALPADIYGITADRGQTAIIDVGGDDRGALALGRLRDQILEENNYEMLFVINRFRPLTKTAELTIEVMREIETAGRIPFTAVINNSNLGDATTAEDVLQSQAYADEVCRLTGLPLKMTTVNENLYPQLEGKIDHLFPLRLQEKIR
ncbi:MAG: P-loop NTPase [Clostridia bacterium]|nr:P-loop NTPase [Clostridia bacterium]